MSAPTTYSTSSTSPPSHTPQSTPGASTTSSTILPGSHYLSTHRTIDDDTALRHASSTSDERYFFDDEAAERYVAEAEQKGYGVSGDGGRPAEPIVPRTSAATDMHRYLGLREGEGDDVGRH
ncbi:hypothetical protein HK097_007958 [Rhizophlyctis rosea]|uniref:Uncharacterized protein n=1 Tax=Rhizophlyctis rosea TaxID=64517 RepID=A0AAD5SAY5_9FUNG|nr:hypothetical protein HK097_007958 [Rhizophlyctis rosea]